MSLKGKHLGVRTVSGAVLAAVVVGAALWSEWAFLVVAAFIAVGAMIEFFRLATRGNGISPQQILAVAVGSAIVIECALTRNPVALLTLSFAFPLFFVVELFRRSVRPLQNIAVSVAGVVYTALPMAMLMLIGTMGEGGLWSSAKVLAIVFLVWINDIFAYLVGCSIGRHRLCERLSPKKSWEGFIGGLICAVGFAALAGWLLEENVWLWTGLGVVVVLGGVAGDLVESMFKREADVKDSGSIIPGHGGLLDRFDAMFIAVPLAYLYLLVFNI